MKKIIYFIGLLIIGFIIVLCLYKPIIVKYLSGNAVIVDQSKNYNLKIEGKEIKNVVFEKENTLIIFLKNQNISKDYSIISVDKENKLVGYNCTSNECYDTFLGKLFQSDMGKMFVLFNDRFKGPNFDSNLKISETSINFYFPNEKRKLFVELNLHETCEY